MTRRPIPATGRTGAALAADKFGRLLPAPNRFPSAAGGKGFKPLADRLHAMGLKLGIHAMRGIPQQAVKADTPIEGGAFTAAAAANPQSVCDWCPGMFGINADRPAGQAWYVAIVFLMSSSMPHPGFATIRRCARADTPKDCNL